jgi:hypothetical protein
MPIERRPVLASYLLILIGFLLLIVVASLLYTPPTPPCVSTACNASAVTELVGLVLMVVGIAYLGTVVYRSPTGSVPEPGTTSTPVYSFTLPPPAASEEDRTPPRAPSSTPAPPTRYCPACGVPVRTDFGFCPRCGQSIP